ncbi:hypothetical protein T492DRAFT_967513 [Pavlovales sp. CCMP2436]|nr:hypothetical protein T492DRAFT_967513 [Pavlovales sp. CCMP2436]
MPQSVATVASPLAVGLVACLIDALEWPDAELPHRLVFGFPVVGPIPSSNLFRPCEQPATISLANFEAGGKGAVERAVAHVARNAKAAIARGERTRVAAAYDQSVAEVSQGLARGPLPRSEVERHNFERLHPIPRGAIPKRETGDDWRAIDDARWSKHNEATDVRVR